MSAYLIPANPVFIEDIAKAIGKSRMRRQAEIQVKKFYGQGIDDNEVLEDTFENAFLDIWSGQTEHDEEQREGYRSDAIAAISIINLKLLTSAE